MSSQQSVTPVGGQQSCPPLQGGGPYIFRRSQKVAILIDGEWFRKELEGCFWKVAKTAAAATKISPVNPIPDGITAAILYKNALLTLKLPEEECFRILRILSISLMVIGWLIVFAGLSVCVLP